MVKSQKCCKKSTKRCGCGYSQRGPKTKNNQQNKKNNNQQNKKNNNLQNKLNQLAAGKYPHALKLAAGENSDKLKYLAAGGTPNNQQMRGSCGMSQRCHQSDNHNPNLDGGATLICRLQTSQDLGIKKQNQSKERMLLGGYGVGVAAPVLARPVVAGPFVGGFGVGGFGFGF